MFVGGLKLRQRKFNMAEIEERHTIFTLQGKYNMIIEPEY
jgi:hypothetical protein